MSARDELYDTAVSDDICDCYPGGADEVNARIDAYRDEVLREAAAKQRDHVGNCYDNGCDDCFRCAGDGCANCERYDVVNLIDPDKAQP